MEEAKAKNDKGEDNTQRLEGVEQGDGPLEVAVEFYSGNPRNNLRPKGGTAKVPSYMEVQRQNRDGEWTTVYTDANWQTRFEWHVYPRGPFELETKAGAHALATLRWFPDEEDRGTFRMCHFGDYRLMDMSYPESYEGCSRSFKVV